MAKFSNGEKVKIISYPKSEYNGRTGKIVGIREPFKESTGSVVPSGDFQGPGTQTNYVVEIDGLPRPLYDLSEDSIESLSCG